MKKLYKEIREKLISGEVNCEGVLLNCLENIKEHNVALNAFVRVYEEESLERAKWLDTISIDKRGSLHGLVVGLKDVFNYKGHELRAGSKILDGYLSIYNATVVERLLDAGAILIGHQNCDEFAMGSSNESSAYGVCKNFLGENLVPGGSSGGSVVAVQAGMCHVSLGTDTGGSVRQPAALCGVVGFKPTYSRVSRYGVVAYASSLDTVGIIARDVWSCAKVLEVIAGDDEYDATVSKLDLENFSEFKEIPKYKIGLLQEAMDLQNLQKCIKDKTKEYAVFLQHLGHLLETVTIPILGYALQSYYIIANVEAALNLACYDGVRYGRAAEGCSNFAELSKATRDKFFGEEVKKRILVGTFVLSSENRDSWILQAQKIRRLICEELYKKLEEYDFLILPTSPSTAFKIGEKSGLDMYEQDYCTVPFSMAGLPSISIPIGLDKDNLPIGLQIVCAPFKEKKLLNFADFVSLNVKKL